MEEIKSKKKNVSGKLSEAFNSPDIYKNDLIRLQADRALNDIIPVIFHKLKNKLTPVLGFAQIIQMKSKDPSISEKAMRIESNAEKLTMLIDKLSYKYTLTPLKKEQIYFDEILKYFHENFENLEKTDVRIHINSEGNPKPINMLKGQILLLLRELIVNALLSLEEKNSKKKEIEIIQIYNEKDFILKIRDNGIGISGEDLKMVPEPFFSKFPERDGIGFLLIDKVLENHRGKYELRADPKEFFEIEISIPLIKSEQETEN